MQIQINSDHHITLPELAGRIQALVRDTLDRYSDRITRVEVHLNDLNSVKAAAAPTSAASWKRGSPGIGPVASNHEAKPRSRDRRRDGEAPARARAQARQHRDDRVRAPERERMSANLESERACNGKHKAMPLFQRLKPLLGGPPAAVPVALPADFRAFPDSQQNPVRYRNLLKELKAALEQKHRRLRCGRSWPFRAAAEDTEFWAHPQDGIAVFGAPGFFHVEKVQRPVPEIVVVNDHLYIKPLVRVFQSEDTYQILALDREEVKLYQGNRYVLDEIVMAPSVPRTIEEALGHGHAAGRRAERHAGPGPRRPRGRVRFTATARRPTRCGSTSSASSASSTAQYRSAFQAFGAAADPRRAARISPAFRDISHNPYLLDEGIHQNIRRLMRREELREEAWRLMEPRYHARLQQLLDMLSRGASARARHRRSHACGRSSRPTAAWARCSSKRTGASRAHRRPHAAAGGPRRARRGDILDDLAERVLKTGGQVIVGAARQHADGHRARGGFPLLEGDERVSGGLNGGFPATEIRASLALSSGRTRARPEVGRAR